MTIATSHPQPPLRIDQAHPNKLSSLPSLPAQQPSEPEPGEPRSDAYGHLSALLKRMKELEEENSQLRARSSCQRPDAAQSFDKGLPTDSQLACRCTSATPNPLTADGEDEIDPLAASTHRGVQDRHKYYRPIQYATLIRDSKGARRSKSYSAFLNLGDKTVFNTHPLDSIEKAIHLYFDQHGFRGFDINLEETQQVIDFKPRHYLFLRVHSLAKFATAIRLPTNGVRITAEFRHIVEKVEVQDDSNHLGSATNFNKPCPTPDWYIDLPPDKLPTSFIRFTASSGEEVLFRPQDIPPNSETPVTPNSDAPHDGENVESQSLLRFGTSVDNPHPALDDRSAHQQEIHNEYLHLKMDKTKDTAERMEEFLKDNKDKTWQEIRPTFPGLGIKGFESLLRYVRSKNSINERPRVLFKCPSDDSTRTPRNTQSDGTRCTL
ncbi:hypothetical protein NCS52_00876500 [Fusarium sp. LHS14.1]|nr:hypothetical protein NCS52_00876500 [Fusarium sp. LHS14.1]